MSTLTLPSPSSSSQEETRILAHQLWQQAGCPHGDDLRFWLAAEEQLRTSQPNPVKRSARPSANGTTAKKTIAKRHVQPAATSAAKAR